MPIMPHFKALELMSMQYEIRICQKILKKATNDKNQHPPPLFSTLRLFLILFGYYNVPNLLMPQFLASQKIKAYAVYTLLLADNFFLFFLEHQCWRATSFPIFEKIITHQYQRYSRIFIDICIEIQFPSDAKQVYSVPPCG